jgi:hypothetical protein
MEKLFESLKSAGIEPRISVSSEETQTPAASGVQERVEARATELRDIWQATGFQTLSHRRAVASYHSEPSNLANVVSDSEASIPSLERAPSTEGPSTVEIVSAAEPRRLPSREQPSDDRTPKILPFPVSAPSAFRDYIKADLATYAIDAELHEESDRYLHPLIQEVVHTEGPVHFETVIERLRERYSLFRAGDRIRSHVENSIRRLLRGGSVEAFEIGDHLILAEPGQEAIPRRPHADGPRRPEHIPPSEILAGLTSVLYLERALRESELVIEAARQFGYLRTGRLVEEVIRRGLSQLKQDGVIEDRAGMLVVASRRSAQK